MCLPVWPILLKRFFFNYKTNQIVFYVNFRIVQAVAEIKYTSFQIYIHVSKIIKLIFYFQPKKKPAKGKAAAATTATSLKGKGRGKGQSAGRGRGRGKKK